MNNSPSKTLYFRNLNEKLPVQELGRRLGALVSRYARVSEVVAGKGFKLRGQAFVTLESVGDAEKVKSLFHNFFFLGRTVEVHFAKNVTKKHGGDEEKIFRPTKTLVLRDLAEDVSKEDLETVFQGEKGFVGVRHVPVKKIALIDFLDVASCEKCFSGHTGDGVLVCGRSYGLESL